MENKNDLSSVQVGDKLYCIINGECEVTEIDNSSTYPISVNGIANQLSRCYTFEGKSWSDDISPTLFWSKPTIICPPSPKRVVKKKVKGWVGFVSLGKKGCEIYPRTVLFNTEAEANEYADQDPSIPRAVYVEHEYEEVKK